jgi:Domain of unknown function (DUF4129)
MTRFWNEMMADLFDVVPVPLLFLGSFVAAALIALGWYFWPDWFSWLHWRRSGEGRDRRDPKVRARWGRLRLGALRWRWRRRRRPERGEVVVDAPELPADELPDLPAGVLTMSADQLAAAGRFKEAVRERMRAIVRDLIERDVLPHTPGWTVTELATAASQRQPALAPPLGAAVDVFSEIWYGFRPATRADDDAMRAHAATVGQIVAVVVAPVAGGVR